MNLTRWSKSLEVTADGEGIVSHAFGWTVTCSTALTFAAWSGTCLYGVELGFHYSSVRVVW